MSPRQIKTWLYFLTQGIALTCGVISVSVSPIVGKALAPSSELSTLPYGIQFATVIACSYVLAMLMQRFGRLKIFLVGSLTLFLAGIAGYISILQQSFSINLLAHILFGVSLSTFAFFRFAATEGLDDSMKSRALSLVTLGVFWRHLSARPLPVTAAALLWIRSSPPVTCVFQHWAFLWPCCWLLSHGCPVMKNMFSRKCRNKALNQ